jgi:hypothetical protein
MYCSTKNWWELGLVMLDVSAGPGDARGRVLVWVSMQGAHVRMNVDVQCIPYIHVLVWTKEVEEKDRCGRS